MKVLIVEDQAQHMADALEVLGKIEGLEIFTATNFEDAIDVLYNHRPDGIITDIFIPFKSGRHSDDPCGLNVATVALTYKIKCVFCTDQYHHGEKLAWINDMFNSLREPLNCAWGTHIIDVDPHYSDGNGGNKNWQAAHDHLFGIEKTTIDVENF